MTTKDYLHSCKLARAEKLVSNKRRRVYKNPPQFTDEIQLIVNKKNELFKELFNSEKLQSIYD